MPSYAPYSDNLETIEPDEAETHAKIIEVMTQGQKLVREKEGQDKTLRISHAKAYGILEGTLSIPGDLAPELAQGLFARPGSHPVVARLGLAPGEYTDDSKVSTERGIALKVFDVEGLKLSPFETITNQDFLMETMTKQFFVSGPKAFLQSFKPNAKFAPKLSDTIKGAVSDVARATDAALSAVGVKSEKMAFFGHPKKHPMAEEYFSQVPFRFGRYVAKFGLVPVTPGLKELEELPFDPQTPNALREATVEFFRSRPVVFDFVVQLCTDLEKMPIEDAQAAWSEDESPYRPVGRLTFPTQDAYEPTRAETVENYSFSPCHSLVEHRPLGGINRARLVVYTAMSSLRRRSNGQPEAEPTSPAAA